LRALAITSFAVRDEVDIDQAGATGLPEPMPGDDPIRFGRYYFDHDCGQPYRRDDHWLTFFGDLADRVVTELRPESVLDAGCAWGLLVEALRKHGVDAYGVDISEYAISNVDDAVREFCWQASLTEALPQRYDLVTCIEVLEHMPRNEAEIAIDNLCDASDRILFSSSPFDYGEPTHVNLRAPEDWSAQFAKRGFLRNVSFDASFLTPWAVLYERSTDPLPEVVRSYDRALWRLRNEQHDLRESVLTLQGRLEDFHRRDTEAELRTSETLKEQLLAARDVVIGHEARLGEALGRARHLEAELVRYQERMDELDLVHRSRAWRALGLLRRLRALVGRAG
jgi:hypothetical protein